MEMRKRTPASFVLWTVASLLMALVLPASLHAQETRARISGRVTDTTQGGHSRSVRDRHGRGQRHDGLCDNQ